MSLVEVTGLWLKENEKSGKFFVGSLGGASIMIFKNKNKTEPKHPDYKMFIGENKKNPQKPKPESNQEPEF